MARHFRKRTQLTDASKEHKLESFPTAESFWPRLLGFNKTGDYLIMKSATMNIEDHISPEDIVLLDEFMDETSSFNASESTSGAPAVSPEALLSVLKDAKMLVRSLHSRQQPTEQTSEIISRLASVEAELADLKCKIADLINKA